MQSDIRIRNVRVGYEDFRYRMPIKFGGVAVDRVTILNVIVDAETRGGTVVHGFGSMPLGNVWSYPSKSMTYDQTLDAMRAVVEKVAGVYRGYAEYGHPIDITWALEHEYVREAEQVGKQLKVADPVPILATMVCASSFDAALHDAFGKAHGRNCFSTYGPEFLPHDLGHYLGGIRWTATQRIRAHQGEAAHAALPFGRRPRSLDGR